MKRGTKHVGKGTTAATGYAFVHNLGNDWTIHGVYQELFHNGFVVVLLAALTTEIKYG